MNIVSLNSNMSSLAKYQSNGNPLSSRQFSTDGKDSFVASQAATQPAFGNTGRFRDLLSLPLLLLAVLGLTTFNPNNEPDFDSSTVPTVDWEALDRIDPDALDNNLPGIAPAPVLTLDSSGHVIPNMPLALPEGEDAINNVPEQRYD